jgi:predicted NBD/HSP70 family sugar kinase
VASEIMGQALDALAQVIVAGAAVIDPAIILLSGTLAHCGESFVMDLSSRMQRYAAPSQVLPEIQLAPWRGEAMQVGMGILALDARRYTEGSGERTTEAGGDGNA